MDRQELVRMANQIAGFFQSYPHDEAVKETAEHIKKFWEPRMRAELKKMIAAKDPGLQGIALEAAQVVTK
jgi:formate dehydrogenase subunit delta